METIGQMVQLMFSGLLKVSIDYITDEYLAAVIADLFIAGSETTTTTLRWSLVLLASHPDVQERLYQEINDTIGTEKLPSVQDRTNLKYVEAFYMEVLR